VFSPDIARVLSDDRPWRPAPGRPRRRRPRRPFRAGLHALAPRLRAAGVHLRAAAHLRRRAA
jgi:hypothetical protein